MANIGTPQSQPQSRLLQIALEVRQKIWEYALPSDERLVLDPESITNSPFSHHPSHPVQIGNYGAAFNLALVSRQVFSEVTPILYSRNIVSIIDPLEFSDFHPNHMSREALNNIRRLEVCLVEGALKELNEIWLALDDCLPAVRDLRLTCYRSPWAYRLIGHLGNLFADGFLGGAAVKIELYESQNLHFLADHQWIGRGFKDGQAMTATYYRLDVPAQLDTITAAISCNSLDHINLRTFINSAHAQRLGMDPKFRFVKDGNKDTATVKYLEWRYTPLDPNGIPQDPAHR